MKSPNCPILRSSIVLLDLLYQKKLSPKETLVNYVEDYTIPSNSSQFTSSMRKSPCHGERIKKKERKILVLTSVFKILLLVIKKLTILLIYLTTIFNIFLHVNFNSNFVSLMS